MSAKTQSNCSLSSSEIVKSATKIQKHLTLKRKVVLVLQVCIALFHYHSASSNKCSVFNATMRNCSSLLVTIRITGRFLV